MLLLGKSGTEFCRKHFHGASRYRGNTTKAERAKGWVFWAQLRPGFIWAGNRRILSRWGIHVPFRFAAG